MCIHYDTLWHNDRVSVLSSRTSASWTAHTLTLTTLHIEISLVCELDSWKPLDSLIFHHTSGNLMSENTIWHSNHEGLSFTKKASTEMGKYAYDGDTIPILTRQDHKRLYQTIHAVRAIPDRTVPNCTAVLLQYSLCPHAPACFCDNHYYWCRCSTKNTLTRIIVEVPVLVLVTVLMACNWLPVYNIHYHAVQPASLHITLCHDMTLDNTPSHVMLHHI